MTRAEYIKVCSVCTNRSFNPKHGIICGLTDKPADFKGNCADYNEDEKEVQHNIVKEKNDKKIGNKAVNKGRIALFVVGGLYVLVGIYESFGMLGANIIFGYIDWSVAAVFLGLAIWSYKKTSLALIIGLAFYCLLIVLLAVIDPMTIIQGIIWKIIIIAWLALGISSARADEAKNKNENTNGDLLDQL